MAAELLLEMLTDDNVDGCCGGVALDALDVKLLVDVPLELEDCVPPGDGGTVESFPVVWVICCCCKIAISTAQKRVPTVSTEDTHFGARGPK